VLTNLKEEPIEQEEEKGTTPLAKVLAPTISTPKP
jgi:hypothetical protein